MKRGYSALVLLSCVFALSLFAGIVLAQLVPADCDIQAAACVSPYNAIGKVSGDGHFNSSLSGVEPNYLCCRYLATVSGVPSTFNVSSDGHISVNSTFTYFPEKISVDYDSVNVELDSCYLKDDCALNNAEECLFNVANSSATVVDNSHVSDCDITDRGAQLCCKFKEKNCSNGIDDDGDTFMDCADTDCQISDSHPNAFVCTGSPLISDYCVQLSRNTFTGVDTTTYNPLCRGVDSNYYYCSYSQVTPGTGVCCPSGQKASYDVFSGWTCVDSERCGLSIPTCDYDFDDSKPLWESSIYDYVADMDWCVTQIPNLYDPDNLTIERSTGCCLIAFDGEVNYFTDDTNVKIYGTS